MVYSEVGLVSQCCQLWFVVRRNGGQSGHMMFHFRFQLTFRLGISPATRLQFGMAFKVLVHRTPELATMLQVASLSCTGMLTVMTSSLHTIKLKLMHAPYLESKLARRMGVAKLTQLHAVTSSIEYP